VAEDTFKDGLEIKLSIIDKNGKGFYCGRRFAFQSDELPMSNEMREKLIKEMIIQAAQGIIQSKDKIMDSVRKEGLTFYKEMNK